MNLPWHIAKKDLRSVWPLLALFGICLAAEWIFGLALMFDANGSNRYWANELQEYSVVFLYLSLGLAVVLGERIVHNDPVVTQGAFWKTRPISGRRLLLGKLLALFAVFAVVPVAVRLPWWLFNRFGVGDVLVAAVDSAAWFGIVGVLALFVAVLTPNFRWFVGGVAMLCGCVSLTIQNVAAIGSWGELLAEEVRSARVWLSLGILGVTVAVVVWSQFLRQDRRRSLIIVAVAILLITGAVNYWPWSLTGAAPDFVQADPNPITQGVTLEFEGAAMYNNRNAQGRLRVRGVPNGFDVTIDASHEWRWPATNDIRFDRGWRGLLPPFSRTNPVELLKAKTEYPVGPTEATRLRRLWHPWELSQEGRFTIPLMRPSILAMFQSAPEYTLRARMELQRAFIAGEVPARAGESISGARRRTRIKSAAVESDGVTINLVESFPAPIMEDIGRSVTVAPSERFGYWLIARLDPDGPSSIQPAGEFWAIDRIGGSAKPITSGGRGGQAEVRSRVAGVGIVRAQIGTKGGLGSSPTVARINYESIPFTRRVDIPRFQLGNLAYAHSPRSGVGVAVVTGAVDKPETKVSLREPWGSTVVAALKAAGGLTENADLDRPVVVRGNRAGRSVEIPFDLRAYLDGRIAPEDVPALEPDDIVEVPRR